MWHRSVGAVLLSIVWAGPARAQESWLSLGADAGLGSVGGEAFSTFHLGLDLQEGGLALSLLGRVRLPLEGRVRPRARDFDEASDYVHILRRLRYRRTFASIRVAADGGELLGLTLGNGSLVRDYANIGDPDHPHAGFHLRLSHSRFAWDAFVDNLVAPRLVATRLAVVPLPKAAPFRLGFSIAVDPLAPRFLALDVWGRPELEQAAKLRVAQSRLLALSGVDVSWLVGAEQGSHLRPYADLNTSWDGLGLHLGVSGHLRLSRLRLGLQLEYRATSSGYAPDYFDTFYDVDRYQAQLGVDASRLGALGLTTKVDQLERGAFGAHGALAQVTFDAGARAQLKLGYRYHEGPDAHRTWLRLVTAPVTALQLGAMVMMRGVEGSAPLAGLTAIVEARYRINRYLYGLCQFSRRWAVAEVSRRYEPLTSFNLALGAAWGR